MLLVDTNIFLAGVDRRSERHHECAGLLRAHHEELASTVAVIAETSWLLLDRLGPTSQADLLRMITTGRLHALELTDRDWVRCLELVERYGDLSLDLIDASLVAVAERLAIATIATLNRRDFTVIRPRHVEAFELLP